MHICPSCSAFVPETESCCPVCDRAASRAERAPRVVHRIAKGLLAIAGGSVVAVTMSACYGAPCYDESGRECTGYDPYPFCDDLSLDDDGDGYCGEFDCDEMDADVHSYASDPEGDAIDQDCDGVDGTLPPTGG